MPMLRAYVRVLMRESDLAHDLLQETCLRILSSKVAPDDAAHFRFWCRGVARNVAAHEFGRRRRDREVLLAKHSVESADQCEDPERSVLVRETLQSTTHRDAKDVEWFVRAYVCDERICDLANEAEQSAAALRMRLMRLRSMLRASLD
jgi:RNA polymerase sigma-70 factor, ECF subfamily